MKTITVFLISLVVLLSSCAENNSVSPPPQNSQQSGNPGSFGETTSIVVYINPKINQGTTGNIIMGTQKEGIFIQFANSNPVITNSSGVAVLTNVPVQNNLPIYINNRIIYMDVLAQLDQYDIIVNYKNDSAYLVSPPLRYRYTGNIRTVNNFDSLNNLLRGNNITVLLDPGIYAGNLEIRGNNICVIGAFDPVLGLLSIINGNVTVYGNNTCIFDLAIAGALTVKGNNFEISYSRFNSVVIENEEVVILRNNVVNSSISVIPNNNVFLFDNINLP